MNCHIFIEQTQKQKHKIIWRPSTRLEPRL